MSAAALPQAIARHAATSGPRPFSGSAEQLAGELGWLEQLLRVRMLQLSIRREERVDAAARVNDSNHDADFDEFAGLYVSEREIARYAHDEATRERVSRDPRVVEARTRAERLRQELDMRALASEESGTGHELRLQRLGRRFALRPIEMQVLVCCLAPDWALRFQRYFAYLQNDLTRRRPTVQLLAELFCGDEGAAVMRAVLSADAPLLRERLLGSSGAEQPFPARQPVVAEAVADYLAGGTRTDEALQGIVTVRQPIPGWPRGLWYGRHRAIVSRLAQPLSAHGRLPTAYVWGASGCGKKLVTNALAALAGVRLLRADCRAWIASGTLRRETLALLRRDAVLHGTLIEIAHCEALLEPSLTAQRTAVDDFVARHDGAGIILTGTASIEELSAELTVPLWSFEIPRPDVAERADVWCDELGAQGWESTDSQLVDTLATSFRFTPREIRRVLDGYRTAVAPDDGAPLDRGALLRVCREASRPTMQRFARRIVPRRGWDDLVLPRDSRLQLEEICAAARCRRRVHGDWGFEQKLALASGITVLFSGPSGVGKTMSAEIVAGDLGLDLFAVDLSCVVSKYIGETERNLSVVFDEAEATNAVLFFDECDALFGKRTEIKDAHDRYANIETNYLLQRIDRYDGIVILATNLRANLDTAFTRRIRYAVEFPFPDVPDRERIWRKVFPSETPVADDVDVEFLARQFKLAGGSIKNIAVNAAFLAAARDADVGMRHVIHATKRELQKMGKSCTKAEFGRYFSWVRDDGAKADEGGGGGSAE